jgi:magnesium-transporting ATPase (P-type)
VNSKEYIAFEDWILQVVILFFCVVFFGLLMEYFRGESLLKTQSKYPVDKTDLVKAAALIALAVVQTLHTCGRRSFGEMRKG